jgi:predicted RNA-binding protein YlqC (UPF0109 family)
VNNADKMWGDGITAKAIRHIVKSAAGKQKLRHAVNDKLRIANPF